MAESSDLKPFDIAPGCGATAVARAASVSHAIGYSSSANMNEGVEMNFEATVGCSSDWETLRSLIHEHGYTTDKIRELLGIIDPAEAVLANAGRYSLMYFDELEQIDSAAAILAQLFMFCGRVPTVRLDRLNPELTSLLWRLRLIEPVSGNPRLVRGAISISELRQRYFLSDTLFENQRNDFLIHNGEKLCMPPHASSLELLAGLQSPPGARSFLDVGCGTGCQSILFASGYERVVGFDPNPRAADFARVNSMMNGTNGRYQQNTWELFNVDEPYHHVAFNSPDASCAFDFINSGIDKTLSDMGRAQIWLCCEVTHDDKSFEGTLRRCVRYPERWSISTRVNVGSPFSVSPELVRARRLPENTLLVSHPAEKEAFVQGLVERRIAEVVSVILTFQRLG